MLTGLLSKLANNPVVGALPFGREVVGGTVVMRTGENARDVIERVKEKIAHITHSLPPGVTIKPFYDRSELIDRTIDTLKHALAGYWSRRITDEHRMVYRLDQDALLTAQLRYHY